MTTDPALICRVDDCERRAVASVAREDLPGPIQLCATHTEDFRLNGTGWAINWSPGQTLPITVKTAPAGPVGRGPLRPSSEPVSTAPGWSKLRSRLSDWRRSGL